MTFPFMFYVYVLDSITHPSFRYVGFSNDVMRRLQEHNAGRTTSTRPYAPFRLVYYEAFCDELRARDRERYLKTSKGKRALALMLGKRQNTNA